MTNKTFDLDDYISQRKEKEPEFAKEFDTGYEEFKIGMMIKEMRLLMGNLIFFVSRVARQ